MDFYTITQYIIEVLQFDCLLTMILKCADHEEVNVIVQKH